MKYDAYAQIYTRQAYNHEGKKVILVFGFMSLNEGDDTSKIKCNETIRSRGKLLFESLKPDDIDPISSQSPEDILEHGFPGENLGD